MKSLNRCSLFLALAVAVLVAGPACAQSGPVGSPYDPTFGTVTADTVTVNAVQVPEIFVYRNFSGTCASSVVEEPAGWVVSCNNYSTGNYTITHNWGHANYSCIAQAAGTTTAGISASMSTMSTVAFTVHLTSIASHAASSQPWQVVCFRYS